ncbi:MAG: penicillin-binding protein activator LpoB [Elusimicrobiota bacterium]|jgi:PBP1b-binding outer membrane lipoprotein LpoB|nr:penicillin-binding protein activator LpoB [Elusimicrobiota bacterium]
MKNRARAVFTALVIAASFSLFACAPAMQSSRVSLDESDKAAANITDKWVGKDTQLAVQDVLKQIDAHRGFQAYLAKMGRKPKLFVSEVQNRTSEAYFPIDDLNDELLNELSAAGQYTLIDASAREKILKEIQYQNDGMVDAAQAKSIGKASGADLLIFGDIRMKPETLNGKTVKDYSVNLRMTNIETGEEVLRVRYRTSKISIQKKSGW